MFYENLLSLCSKNRISVTRAVSEMGFATSAPATWKRGKLPSGRSLTKIAEYFGVTVDYLLDGEDKEKAAQSGGENIDEEIIRLFAELSPQEQAALLDYWRYLISKREG